MTLLKESGITLKLALPLIIGQVSQMLIGVADTVMLGKVGVTELAVLTFANSLFYVPFVFGIGLLTSVSVFTSNARGAGDTAAGRSSCRDGLQVSVVLGLILAGISLLFTPFLDRFGQPPEVVAHSRAFYQIIMLSLLPALMSIALKNHADAMDHPWPAFWICLGGVFLNIFLNWVLIYGNLGSPILGLEGAAWATLISRILIVIALFVWLKQSKSLREWVPRRWLKKPANGTIRRFLRIGFPASLQMFCEVTAFSLAGLLTGRFGENAMAAHQIALMCAATAFMIPLGLAMALSVRIGAASGAEEIARLRPIAVSGWMIGVGWAVIGALVFVLFGKPLARCFNDSDSVVILAAQLLVVVGIFQIFDSLQVASSAMLRGMHDTRVPALLGFVAYWVIGIPVAILLSAKMEWGVIGVWWGLALGLAVACVTLCQRTWMLTRTTLSLHRAAS